jgi:hypothetical protein
MAELPPDAGTLPAQQGGNEPPATGLTQAEVDAIVKDRLDRDRKSREDVIAKDLGMSLKEAKALIKSKKDADDAAKSDLEKVTGERDAFKSELTGAKLEAVKIRALAKAGADPEKLDLLLKRVVGSTPDEIDADVAELKALGLLQPKPSNAAQGAGNPGLQQKQADPSIDERIAAAEKAGLWTLATSLTLEKQRSLLK